MSAESVAASMRARMPWPIGRRILALNDLPRGQGWERTVEHLTADELDLSEALPHLTEALRQHLLSGEKLVRFYRSDAGSIARLRVQIRGLVVPETRARECYPALLPAGELRAEPVGIQLVAIEDSEEGTAVIFSSIRVMAVRESLEPEELPDEARERFADFEEIFGIKNVRTQAFDVIWLPNDGDYVDIRVDFPLGTVRELGVAAQETALNAFKLLVPAEDLRNPVNLFPLIERMYVNDQEGMVVELAFGTTTASLKHEKMRRRSSCLREEHYHRAGKAALAAPIEPFKLSIAWRRNNERGLSTQPELSLHSSSRASGASNAVLADAVVRKCIGLDDFSFVRERVEEYLRNLEGEQIAREVA